MQRLPDALDMDALRSFVLGIEAGSFAAAASRLCRSTSAVSAQLKKLEMQCGAALVKKQGRHLALTAEGERFIHYARRLLALNDEALLAVKGELLHGEARIGMQEDFGELIMPDVLGRFSRQHPGVRITGLIERNQPLVEGIRRRALDLALVWQTAAEDESATLGHCLLEWIVAQECDIAALIARGEPLPLVMFDAPCLMRSRATACLDRAGIPWRMAFVSHSLSGIWAAVRAGIGITLRTRLGLPPGLRADASALPAPGRAAVALLENSGRSDDAVRLLRELMRQAISPWLSAAP